MRKSTHLYTVLVASATILLSILDTAHADLVGHGWIEQREIYYSYLPDANHWQCFLDSSAAWNTVVDDNPSGTYSANDWLIGYYTSGGNPIRDRLPSPNNGDFETGVLTSTQMGDRGYDSWTDLGANGITYYWYAWWGIFSNRIQEADAFVNPDIADDPAQHRKTLTHEFGHALGLNHEERYFELMYPGTYQQPPNYASVWYNRLVDIYWARNNLTWVNAEVGETVWVLENWADMAVWSQTHSNSGSDGSLVMTNVSPTVVNAGGSITIEHIHVENRGNVGATNVTVRFYLSENDIISSSDYEIGSIHWDNFAASSFWANGSVTFTLPTGIPSGTYYVGLIVETNSSERSTANNAAILMDGWANDFSERTVRVCTVEVCDGVDNDCDGFTDEGGNSLCSDSTYCNGTEICAGSSGCQAGTPPNCNDGISCTTDSCNEAADRCDHTTNNGVCSDGQYCNGTEYCDASYGCRTGTPPNCNDGISCTTDSCNESADSCDHTPNNGVCSDGQYCNGTEYCDASYGCRTGTSPNCNDGISCTADSCNESADGCDHTPNNAVCNDGQYCNGVEYCDASVGCQAGASPNCQDADPCTSDICDESADTCLHLPGGPEICDGVDNNCDTQIDEGCDDDDDGFCDLNMDIVGVPPTCPWGGGDCNDDNPSVNYAREEACNGIDDDCDGGIDEEGARDCSFYYVDLDRDGFGEEHTEAWCLCEATYPATATQARDCADWDPEVNPSAPEHTCNSKDDDCNEATLDNPNADGDPVELCSGDCDDNDPNNYPGNREVCDGQDNNCDDGTDDPGAGGCTLYYRDMDSDGYGVTADKQCLCAPSFPYTAAQFFDCNDDDSSIYPGAGCDHVISHTMSFSGYLDEWLIWQGNSSPFPLFDPATGELHSVVIAVDELQSTVHDWKISPPDPVSFNFWSAYVYWTDYGYYNRTAEELGWENPHYSELGLPITVSETLPAGDNHTYAFSPVTAEVTENLNGFLTSNHTQGNGVFVWNWGGTGRALWSEYDGYLTITYTYSPAPICVPDYYVAPGGDDATGEGSQENPWCTIQHAVDTVVGTASCPINIHVSAGTYYEHVELDEYESIYGGYDPATWTQDPNQFETIIDGGGIGNVVDCLIHNTIEGFTIQNGETGISTMLSPVVIERNVIRNCGTGISLATYVSHSPMRVSENKIYRNGYGVVDNGADLGLFNGNIVADNVEYGLGVFQSPYTIVEKNVMVGNRVCGLSFCGMTGRVQNNLIAGSEKGIASADHYCSSWFDLLDNAIMNCSTGLSLDVHDMGVAMDAANNLFYHSYMYGIFYSSLTNYGAPVLRNNNFFGEAAGIYYDPSTQALYTDCASLNANLGEAQDNICEYPAIRNAASGTVSYIGYDPETAESFLEGIYPYLPDDSLAGALLNPNITQNRLYYIIKNFGKSVTVLGDMRDVANVGDRYVIIDPHLTSASPLVNAGIADANTPPDDVDGDSRPIDGVIDTGIDIGFDEYGDISTDTNADGTPDFLDDDDDGDGLPDVWEHEAGLDYLDATGDNGPNGDPDNDGLTNLEEYQTGADPTVADTDGDGYEDGVDCGPIDPAVKPEGIEQNCADGIDNDCDGSVDRADSDCGPITIYVDDGATCPGSGTDGEPYCDIQSAINNSYVGDTIIVRDGAYRGANNKNLDFGGRAITLRSENGPANCVIDCEGSWDDESRAFYFHRGETSNSVLDGFTITNGFKTEDWSRGGAGILCDGSSPTVRNCVIRNNWALSSRGGGIYCSSSSAILENCNIQNNYAFYGGGVYCSSSPLTITACTINNNFSDEAFGGGIYCSSSSPILTNCVITKNEAFLRDGGGMYCDGSTPTIKHCTITGNIVSGLGPNPNPKGGGIFCSNSSPAISGSIVWGNTASEIEGCLGEVTYSNVQEDNYPGEGNINADPLFVDASNYHLKFGSPCIDAASGLAGVHGDDMDGNPRPFDVPGIDNNGPLPDFDMGAYEFQAIYVDDSRDTNEIAGDEGSGTPADPYDGIQRGVDEASTGYLVVVRDGVYRGIGNKNIDFGGRAITLRSENGPANCIIDCEHDGRGFYFHNGESSTSVLDGFTITNGHVADGLFGGGISCEWASPTLTNCIVTGNFADGYGGGISFHGSSSPIIANCTITHNVASAGGGGISCYETSANIRNCTIADNSSSHGAADIYLDGDGPSFSSIVSSIMWDDSAGTAPQIALTSFDSDTALSVSYSDIEGGEGAVILVGANEDEFIWGEGNIDTDPLFVDAANGDYRVQPCSPTIDAGIPYAIDPILGAYSNEPEPNGGRVNMGADGNTPDAATSDQITDDDGDGYSECEGDCNDADSSNFFGNLEVCDGQDNDCDDLVDDADPSCEGKRTFYLDADDDGCAPVEADIQACAQPPGSLEFFCPDCQPNNPNVHPDAQETCNGIDDDCDGLIDAADPSCASMMVFYRDGDMDGFGDCDDSRLLCAPEPSYMALTCECDDTNPNIHPGAPEVCDGIDNDCDGQTDENPEADSSCVIYDGCTLDVCVDGACMHYDQCDDGVACTDDICGGGVCQHTPNHSMCQNGQFCDGVESCDPVLDCRPGTDPCDDGNPCTADTCVESTDTCGHVSGGSELCNGTDDDCDGLTDCDDPDMVCTAYCRDADGDGYGNPLDTVLACEPPPGYADECTDCNDSNPLVNQGTLEVCDNTIDDDCDTLADCNDPDCAGDPDCGPLPCPPFDLPLARGYNPVGPAVDLGPTKAEDVCADIAAIGGSVDRVIRYNTSTGMYETHICGLPFNNFDVYSGKGYFIRSSASGQWAQQGCDIPSPLEICLLVGYNSISLPRWVEDMNAEDLCAFINSAGGNVDRVIRYNTATGMYETHICGLPFNNFMINPGVAYFVRSRSAHCFSVMKPVVISNLTHSSATISWVSDTPATGQIEYGTSIALGNIVDDARGASTVDDTHYVVLSDLSASVMYYFDVITGAATDDNGGAHYSFMTGADLGLPGFDLAYGRVFLSDALTVANGTIVYVRIADGDGLGSTGGSSLLSDLVEASGYWVIELGTARIPDSSSYFMYSPEGGDDLVINADGAGAGKASQVVDTANDVPAPDMVLSP